MSDLPEAIIEVVHVVAHTRIVAIFQQTPACTLTRSETYAIRFLPFNSPALIDRKIYNIVSVLKKPSFDGKALTVDMTYGYWAQLVCM